MRLRAGTNIRADSTQQYNISISLMDGEITKGGIYGLRVDYWDEASNSFPPKSSYFFYDASHDFQVCHWAAVILTMQDSDRSEVSLGARDVLLAPIAIAALHIIGGN